MTILGFPRSPCIQLLILDYSGTRSDRDYASTHNMSKLIKRFVLLTLGCFAEMGSTH